MDILTYRLASLLLRLSIWVNYEAAKDLCAVAIKKSGDPKYAFLATPERNPHE